MAKIKVNDKLLRKIIKEVANADVRGRLIADGVEYGVFQEFGKNGHPSLVPAFEKVTKDLPEAIGQAVEKAINPDNILHKAANDIQSLWASDVNVDTGAYKNSIHVEVL